MKSHIGQQLITIHIKITIHTNVNSLRNKFQMLEELIKDKIDIFVASETKLDSSFPSGQFVIKGYSTPFRLDRDQNVGGLLLYVREDIHVRFWMNTLLKNL